MREVAPSETTDAATLGACIATILELTEVPVMPPGEPFAGWRRWLGGLGMGLVPIADAASFAWAGPWIGWIRASGERRAVVMYGSPAGVVWDPAGITSLPSWTLDGGYVIAALDIALARPPRLSAPTTVGTVESIWIAEAAGRPARSLTEARARAGLGLEGDRYVSGAGTFSSGAPGSALTLIEAEVCESFEPPLRADEHRRNIVTRGISLNGLVGRELAIGATRCRGMRLCEPCTVVERYANRPVLRPLVHRGGLRVDILADGIIRVGDRVELAE